MKRASAIGKAGKEGFLVLICSLAMAFQPLFGSPSGAIGTVSSNGEASLNGSRVPNGAVVYTGDRVATTADGSAALHLERGAEVALGGATAAQVTAADKGFTVSLEQGRLEAVAGTQAPIVVESDGLTITPKQENGSYEVSLNGDALEVMSRHGTTVAEAANRTVEIPEGMTLKATMAQGPPATGHKKKKKMVLALLIASGVTGAGLGIALAEPTKKCTSATELTCP